MKRIAFIFMIMVNIKAISQTFNPAYVITEDEDSVSGYILDQIDQEIQSKIEFKKKLSDIKSILYTPKDILGFSFDNGRSFERQTFIQGSDDTIYIFAKRKIQGKINLYVNRTSRIDDQKLFLKNNKKNEVVCISKPKKVVNTRADGTKYSHETKTYLGLLNYIAPDSSNYLKYNNISSYSPKQIIKRIRAYNELFADEYDVSNYSEEKRIRYNVNLGVPTLRNINGTELKTTFRVAFYRNKSYPERTRKLSYMSGLSYRYTSWLDGDNNTSEIHFLTLIPIGFNLHRSKGIIRPYAYFGFGITLFNLSDYVTEKYFNEEGIRMDATKREQDYGLLPGVNIGTGIKIKTGEKFVNLEITPAVINGGIFINIGYTI